MADNPGIGGKIVATITGVKGECGAGHLPWREGDTTELQSPDNHDLVTLKLQRFERH